MPAYVWTARDTAGKSQRGTTDAADADAVARDLRERGWLILSIDLATAGSGAQAGAGSGGELTQWMPIRSLDVEVGLHQLAVMVRSGVTLLGALKLVAKQSERKRMAAIWAGLAERIAAGSSLGDAMTDHRRFPPMTVQLVRLGEQTGTLEAVLMRAAEAIARRRAMRAQMLSMLMYPVIVLVLAVAVAVFLVVYVLPKIRVFLESMGREVPGITQFLLDVADWLDVNGIQAGIGLVVAIGGGVALYHVPSVRLWIDRLLLRVPVVGRLLRVAATITFARSLVTLIHSGVTLLDGLKTSETLIGNRHLRQLISRSQERVTRGGTLAEGLEGPGAFMPMLPHMVAVGEASGTLDDVLDHVREFLESYLSTLVRRLSSLVEPVIILAVGGIVGVVYIAFFAALFAAGGAL